MWLRKRSSHQRKKLYFLTETGLPIKWKDSGTFT